VSDLKLMEHQIYGIDWLYDRPRALLADEPGLGKSAQLLYAAKEPVLILAPAMVIDGGTWDDEIAKWTPGIDATQVPWTSLTARVKVTAATGRTVSKPTDKLRSELRREWGSIIADEAHYIKNRKTTWTKAFQTLQSPQLHLATGTPIPNWAQEVFVLARALRPETPGFTHYWPWAKEWFDCAPTRWSPMEVGELRKDRTWEGFFEANFGPLYLARLRDDVLDLPPLLIKPQRVKMAPKQATVYRKLKRDFIAWLESGTEVVAWTTGAQLVKLCKAATGLEVLEEGAGGSAKLDALKELLVERDRPTLVVGHFQATVAACGRVSRDLGRRYEVLTGATGQTERGRIVRAFQNGELDVLCASIDTIREGLTLTKADMVIRVERSWRPSSNDQVNRRLHRIGQDRPVYCVDLITADTIDERVLEVLAAKTDQQMKILGRGVARTLA
jgi:SNF2 family DNA or RNA helicase